MDKKKTVKSAKKTSRTPVPYEYFEATEVMPGEGPVVQLEIIREQLVRMMTGMDQKDAERMADYVVHLIARLRELSDQNASLRTGRSK